MRRRNLDDIRDINSVKKVKKVSKKNIVIMFVWIAITIFMITQIVQVIRYTLGMIPKEKAVLYNIVNNVFTKIAPNISSDVEEEYKLNLAALGDIYITENVLNGSKESNGYDFITGTEEIQEELKKYDLVISGFSNSITGKKVSYSKDDEYNAPEEIIELLKKLNISAVATASYHILDKGESGALYTSQILKDNQIQQVGINESEELGKPVVITKNNITIGILSYATTSKVKMGADDEYVLDVLNEEDLKSDIEYLKSKNVDYIISYLNVNNANSELPNSTQKQNTEMLFNAGVNVVIGTGAKIIQEETEDIININNQNTHVYAAYCLGDFIGEYKTDNNRENAIANIEFYKKVIKNKKGEIINQQKDMKVNDLIKIEVDVKSNYSTIMKIMELN